MLLKGFSQSVARQLEMRSLLLFTFVLNQGPVIYWEFQVVTSLKCVCAVLE